MANLFSLEGKNAWITGASYGIGFNIAKAFVAAGIKTIMVRIKIDSDLRSWTTRIRTGNDRTKTCSVTITPSSNQE